MPESIVFSVEATRSLNKKRLKEEKRKTNSRGERKRGVKKKKGYANYYFINGVRKTAPEYKKEDPSYELLINGLAM